MKNFIKYGSAPYSIVLVHGGPGAAGELAPVAQELSCDFGIIEALQTESSIDRQVAELKIIVDKNGDIPVTLIGHSWGAWLAMIFAARYPVLVKKLILIGSGPFEEKYTAGIMSARMSRLDNEIISMLCSLSSKLNSAHDDEKDEIMAVIGQLISQADTYSPLPDDPTPIKCSYQIFEKVWAEAEMLRKSGELLRLCKKIHCPLIAIHGDYDPHPYEGVEIPLSSNLKDFRLILLEKCGHDPWRESYARDRFYVFLREFLA